MVALVLGLALGQEAALVEVSATDLVRTTRGTLVWETEGRRGPPQERCSVRTRLTVAGVPDTIDVGGEGCSPEMAEAVAQTVLQWRWEPFAVEGQGIPVWAAFDAYYTEASPAPTDAPDVDADGAYRIHYGVVHVKSRVAPRYPKEARKQRLGDVRCLSKVKIAEDGVPYDVAVENCPDVFHDATHEAILKWRWHPPLMDGHPVKAQVTIGVNFRRE